MRGCLHLLYSHITPPWKNPPSTSCSHIYCKQSVSNHHTEEAGEECRPGITTSDSHRISSAGLTLTKGHIGTMLVHTGALEKRGVDLFNSSSLGDGEDVLKPSKMMKEVLMTSSQEKWFSLILMYFYPWDLFWYKCCTTNNLSNNPENWKTVAYKTDFF